MRDNCIKALFDISVVDSEWNSKKLNNHSDAKIGEDLKELLDNLWYSPRELQKWYEQLI